jgi:hypothetical protein
MTKNVDAAPKHGVKPESISKPQQLAAAVIVAGIALGACFMS